MKKDKNEKFKNIVVLGFLLGMAMLVLGIFLMFILDPLPNTLAAFITKAISMIGTFLVVVGGITASLNP